MTDKENRKMSINAILTNILRVFIIILAIVLCIEKDYKNMGILALTMVLTFYDKIVAKVFKIELEEKLKIAKNMHKENYSVKEIAKITKLDCKTIEKLK